MGQQVTPGARNGARTRAATGVGGRTEADGAGCKGPDSGSRPRADLGCPSIWVYWRRQPKQGWAWSGYWRSAEANYRSTAVRKLQEVTLEFWRGFVPFCTRMCTLQALTDFLTMD